MKTIIFKINLLEKFQNGFAFYKKHIFGIFIALIICAGIIEYFWLYRVKIDIENRVFPVSDSIITIDKEAAQRVFETLAKDCVNCGFNTSSRIVNPFINVKAPPKSGISNFQPGAVELQ